MSLPDFALPDLLTVRNGTPLAHRWALWAQKKSKKSAATGSWYDGTVCIGRFDTVEGFWQVYSHMVRTEQMGGSLDVMLFKDGIKPFWEDAQNRYGGRWTMRIRKHGASTIWEEILLAIVGEQFDGAELCGAVLSVRYHDDHISIWNKSADNEAAVASVRDVVMRTLQLPASVPFDYTRHKHHDKDKGDKDKAGAAAAVAPGGFAAGGSGGGEHHHAAGYAGGSGEGGHGTGMGMGYGSIDHTAAGGGHHFQQHQHYQQQHHAAGPAHGLAGDVRTDRPSLPPMAATASGGGGVGGASASGGWRSGPASSGGSRGGPSGSGSGSGAPGLSSAFSSMSRQHGGQAGQGQGRMSVPVGEMDAVPLTLRRSASGGGGASSSGMQQQGGQQGQGQAAEAPAGTASPAAGAGAAAAAAAASPWAKPTTPWNVPEPAQAGWPAPGANAPQPQPPLPPMPSSAALAMGSGGGAGGARIGGARAITGGPRPMGMAARGLAGARTGAPKGGEGGDEDGWTTVPAKK